MTAGARVLAAVALVAAGVGLLQAASVHPGHAWSGLDDFTAYLLHGRNLLEGRPYAEIDPVTDPDLPPLHARTAFPPVYPLVLALVDRATRDAATGGALGIDFVAMKRVGALCFAAALLAMAATFRRRLPAGVLLVLVALVGVMPYLFVFRDFVRSEALFVLLLYLWFAVLEPDGVRPVGRGLLGGLLMYLAYGTRTAGIVLIPTLVLFDLLRHRSLRRSTWIALIVGGLGIVAQKTLLSSVEAGYAAQVLEAFRPGLVLENLQQFRWNFERILENGFSPGLRLVVTVIVAGLAAVGLLGRARRPGLPEVFLVLYMLMLLVLPTVSAWMRYLVPVLPIVLFLALDGALRLAGEGRRRLGVVGLPVAALVLTYAGAYASMQPAAPEDALARPTTVELLDWVREHTDEHDVIVFRKPRLMTLATGRPALVYPERAVYGELPAAELLRHLQAVGARVLALKHSPRRVVGPYNTLDFTDGDFLREFVEPRPERFRPVFRNDDFAVFLAVPGP